MGRFQIMRNWYVKALGWWNIAILDNEERAVYPKASVSRVSGKRGKLGPNNGCLDFILRIKANYCKCLGREMKQHKYHLFNLESSQLSGMLHEGSSIKFTLN